MKKFIINNRLRKLQIKIKKMNKKIIVIIFIIICLFGLLIGFFSTSYKILFPELDSKGVQLIPQTTIVSSSASTVNVSPTIKPTWPPISEQIKSISDNEIIVTGKTGDMSLPKDPAKIRVYKRSGNQLILSSFEDVKVGQEVSLKVITPGKLADLIIER